MSICKEFNSLTPFELRRTRYSEFCLFVKRMNKYNKKEPRKEKKQVIRRPAGDNWF
ncbi:hypothetical protein [Eubacterium ventriosum]|uniref:hypothetical protein n=1 Tax=Eubacterium ventriosum TaxID=39496 RepID=UPI00265D85D5|nr:hypothetical protein [Eubacterium ventriosum]